MTESGIDRPDAFLFDVFGVLIKSQGKAHVERIERELGQPHKTSKMMEVYNELRPALDAGRVSEISYWNQIKLRAGLEFLDPVEAIEVDYRGVVDLPNREVIDFMLELKDRGHTVGILSNIPPGLADDLREKHSAWLDRLDAVNFSYEIDAAKPEAEAFHHALESLGRQAGSVVFIDDHLVNVEAARKERLHAIHFQGIDSLRNDPLMGAQ
ncbi:HAD family hydrolase [Corynebacterium flavescens]|uniref:HAD family hydrolase n=1 Tax=Corynebacterium flavescens TaxID=28028 RepID=UPI00264A3A59|nr:HAD family phosphatase [Corynebacterium flavescens]MDN6431892.1 HAD family phosphatase [Corynebacterium flavescens]MDN6475833.1 HAD family phosphatase [Corynebacterium flavescens]MDN6601575.1 HAD family phosphatase [Corynebacterium flavescens]MDN6823744.1 HAD family phosphatase [Corynebacterium flavescens]